MPYVFVDERPSPTAAARGWTWESGHLCAATLFDALRAAGVEPTACRFVNLWTVPGLGRPHAAPALAEVREFTAAGYTVVALGRLVARVLTQAGIPHLALRHPAARGAGRARDHYRAHVRSVLQGDAHVHTHQGRYLLPLHGLSRPPGVLPHGDLGGGRQASGPAPDGTAGESRHE